MSLLGELTYFLGLQISQQEKGIFICQAKYIKEMLKKFKMEDCKLILTLMVTGCKLSIDDSSKDVDQRLYRSMLSSLPYVTASQPDVMQAVGQVARFQAAPKESHIKYSPALEYVRRKLGILPSSHYIFPFQNIKEKWK